MPASSQLVRRSGDLKGELVDFARGRRFARTFRQALEQRFGGLVVTDEGEFINFLDWFVLEHRLPSGRTVVEEFTAARPDLAEEERAMLLGWRDVVDGGLGRDRGTVDVVPDVVNGVQRARQRAGQLTRG